MSEDTMDDPIDVGLILDQSVVDSRSDSKVIGVGEKRSFDEAGEKAGHVRKKTKMRDLEEVFRAEGIDRHFSKPSGCKETKTNHSSHFSKRQETSQSKEGLTSGTTDAVTGENTLSMLAHAAYLSGTALDPNPEVSSNSAVQDPSYRNKMHDHVKPWEGSECGSSTGPLEQNGSLQKWNELKKNGFLSSSSHGSIPLPKHRGKKRKDDSVKKHMEIAKREQVNRFSKVAAPSGLLNGLNPGIINHVRNSKQVHAIFAALMRSEKRKKGNEKKLTSNSESGVKEHAERRNDSVCSETHEYQILSRVHTISLSSRPMVACRDPDIMKKRDCNETSGVSHLASDNTGGKFAGILSPSTVLASQSSTSMSYEISSNQERESNLSIKGANVASQWLELMFQDIKGRLAALRRSKKRVESVIQTELPFLVSRECSTNQERDFHRARWSAIFGQMEKTLTEEGLYLENWLNQVKEMRMHCELGLQYVNWHSLQLLVRPEYDPSRLMKVNAEREIAMKAAAASIYSVCNS
ncbi:hypothetical protein GIB67_041119, partial [Kingdonia uniflora]